jgi:glutaryl-CoA dehydrogenase (non-decarboxylating)
MLAELRLPGCRVPASALVGRVGFGLTAVATSALDVGRYSVAWDCVGLAQACLDISIEYASQREQFGKRLSEHRLIQQLIADMVTT